jgi:WD40 repeat protein
MDYRGTVPTPKLTHQLFSLSCLTNFYDSIFIFASSDCSIILWNTSTLTINSVIKSQPAYFTTSLRVKSRLIYPSSGNMQVWSLDRNILEAEFTGHSNDLYFSLATL